MAKLKIVKPVEADAITELDFKTLASRIKSLIDLGDDAISKKAYSHKAELQQLAKDFKSGDLKSRPSALRDFYLRLNTVINDANKIEAAEDGAEEPAEKLTVNESKAKFDTLTPAEDKKYEKWKKDCKAVGIYEANENLGDGNPEMIGDIWRLRISQKNRICCKVAGKTVHVLLVGNPRNH